MEKMGKWYNSSADAKKLSLAIRGIFTIGIISTIVFILGFLGLDINVSDINSLLDSVQGIIVAIGTLGGLIMGLYGILRRLYYKIKE